MQPRLLKHPARLAGASLLRLQDDERLVALAREGHDPAFSAIVDRYQGPLERYCARLLGPGRAEDAVQQAFVNAHAAMRASDQELALKPWLYRIAHNASLNILRGARDEDVALDEDRSGATQPTDVVELRERLRETLSAIQALPAPQRDALLLRELEGRSHDEIAVALGVSAGGARQHLHRARLAVRAAASAITPYPLLARVLTAAAAEGGRTTDLVAGAGLGAGAGMTKAAAGLLATGAIVGGAITASHHAPLRAADRAHRDGAATVTAAARGATSGAEEDAAAREAPAFVPGARGHGGGRHAEDGDRHRGSGGDDGRRHDAGDDHGGERRPSGGSGPGGPSDGSLESDRKSGSSGGGGHGSDDAEADDHGGTSGSSGSGSSGSGSDDGLSSGSGSDDGLSSGSDSSGSGSDDGLSSGSGSDGVLSSGSGSSGSGSDDGLSSGSGSGGVTTTPETERDSSGPGSGELTGD